MNVKQSTLAQHFSLKSNITKQESSLTNVAITEPKAKLIKRNELNKAKLDNDKTSVQYSSRSYFRLGKNVERNFFKERNHQPASMPEMVKGAENFLKSRSKPARTSVKITEIRPVAIGEGLLEINTKQINDKTTAKDAEMKNFGLMNVENIKYEARPVVRNHSRGSNHRKVRLLTNI